jgi:Alpha 1,4-glycosyltransferase conserved region
LWSYDPENLEGVPHGTNLRNAAEVMPQERLLRYRDSGSVALGANFWRIELLAKGLGCWVDMDFIFLKPLDFDSEYIFGWEYENWVNNAVLWAPAQSDFVADLRAIPKANLCPPWWGPKNRLKFYWRRLREGPIALEDYPWGTFSAGLVTYGIKRNGLNEQVQAPDVFYPVRWKDARSLYEPSAVVEAMLTERTHAVHMWHSRLQGLKDVPPPPGTFIDKMCQQFGVDPY